MFPGTGAGGFIIEPRKQMAHVTKMSDIHFTVHDLHRTFITVAESLDIPAYALKWLLNHKMNGDITASKLKRMSTWEEVIIDYKDYGKAIKKGIDPKPMQKLREFYQILKGK